MKNKVISGILKVVLAIIIINGIYTFFYWELYEEQTADVFFLLQVIWPILIFGFSGIILGIIGLLNAKKSF